MTALAENSTNQSFVTEINGSNFMQDVIQASSLVPVIAYFTASWCGPCKAFSPLLEKTVNNLGGRLRLARIDVDQNQQIAKQLQIQSVPMVYIFINGQPVDAFAGAMTETELKNLFLQFIEPSTEEQDVKTMLESAKAIFQSGDNDQAAAIYEAILQVDKENINAIAGLAKCYILLNNLEEAQKLISNVSEQNSKNELIVEALAMLKIAQSSSGSDIKELQDKINTNEQDYASKMQLANLFFISNQHEKAVDELLLIIKHGEEEIKADAKTKLLEFFEALGMENQIAKQGRRKLSALLFR